MSLFDKDLNRQIIAENIDRHPVGRRLTSGAREQAIDFGVEAWKGNMGNGTAADLGVKHVTQGSLPWRRLR